MGAFNVDGFLVEGDLGGLAVDESVREMIRALLAGIACLLELVLGPRARSGAIGAAVCGRQIRAQPFPKDERREVVRTCSSGV